MSEIVYWVIAFLVIGGIVVAAVTSSPSTHAAGDDRYIDENGRIQTPGVTDVIRTPRATYADEPDQEEKDEDERA